MNVEQFVFSSLHIRNSLISLLRSAFVQLECCLDANDFLKQWKIVVGYFSVSFCYHDNQSSMPDKNGMQLILKYMQKEVFCNPSWTSCEKKYCWCAEQLYCVLYVCIRSVVSGMSIQ